MHTPESPEFQGKDATIIWYNADSHYDLVNPESFEKGNGGSKRIL